MDQMAGPDHAGALAEERPSNIDSLEGFLWRHSKSATGGLLPEGLLEEVKCVAHPA